MVRRCAWVREVEGPPEKRSIRNLSQQEQTTKGAPPTTKVLEICGRYALRCGGVKGTTSSVLKGEMGIREERFRGGP